MKQQLIILFLCAAASAGANTTFNDYKVILNRKPFGNTPASVSAPSKSSVAANPLSTYRLSALYEGIDGLIRAGLVNKQTGKSLILRKDAPEEGVKLVTTDMDNDMATIIERGQTYILELTAVKTQPTQSDQKKNNNNSRTSSFAERRKNLIKTINSKKDESEEKPRLRGEALTEHLQNYQMEVIRQGMPALPIQLTEEMDNQLVEEGVLDPI